MPLSNLALFKMNFLPRVLLYLRVKRLTFVLVQESFHLSSLMFGSVSALPKCELSGLLPMELVNSRQSLIRIFLKLGILNLEFVTLWIHQWNHKACSPWLESLHHLITCLLNSILATQPLHL
eukprot:Lithocolla_globosa_v1_NODE_37_length_8440_cov_24.995110.p3 type:complete len:122 gc:universal NODE_37_length_8440_cov_24.995110:4086-3721(-)